VIATTASPLPQLLEGGGIFIHPGDEEAPADGMLSLASDEQLARTLGERTRQRAAALSWEQSGRAALGALKEAAS